MATIYTHHNEMATSARFERILVALGNVKRKDVIVQRVTSYRGYGVYVVARLKSSREHNQMAGHILSKRGLEHEVASYNGPVIICRADEYDAMNEGEKVPGLPKAAKVQASTLRTLNLPDDLWAVA